MKKNTFIQVFMILLLVLAPAKALALEITSVSPSGTLLHSNIVLEVATDVNSECNYLVGSKSGIMNGNNTSHTKTIQLDDGEYTAYFSCGNSNSSNTAQTSFEVDTLPPTITLTDFPEVITNQPFQATITTSEMADCKYSQTKNVYELMEGFLEKINNKKHYTIIEGKSQGFYTYNIACKDETNKVNIVQKEFFVNKAPNAQIQIEKDDPIKAGIYEVTVLTSEILSQTPALSYSFGGTTRGISLTKTGEGYKGYLLIEENDGTNVATFSFRGIDASGLEGKEITQGKIFLIDTIKPEVIEEITAKAEDDKIELEWNYEQDYSEFKIYRSTSPDVKKTDEYKTTDKKEYADTDVDEGQTYFYKISAIDKAGNIGDLSEEIEVLALKVSEEDSDGLNPSLSFKLEGEISDAEAELFDYESAQKELQRNTNGYVAKIDARYGVSSELNSAIQTIKNIIKEMENMFDQDLSEDDYQKRISKYDEQINNIKSETVTKINVLDEKTVSLTPNEAKITAAINEYLLGTEIDAEDRQNYTLQMNELQSKISVVATIVTAELETEYDDKKITYVEKQVSADEPINKASIVEIIPKEFARSASQISFSNSPIILQDDPIVQWDLSELTTQQLSYSLEEQKNTNLISLTDTVVLTRPKISSNEVPIVTGNVVLDDDEQGSSAWKYVVLTLFVVIIAGLAVYYLTFNKKVVIDDDVQTAFENKKISNLLDAAHQAVDQIQVDKAKTLYLQSYELYLALDSVKKEGVYHSLNNLHNKLMLLSNLGKAHDAIDANDEIKYRQSIVAINSLKKDTVVGSPLHNYLESSFRYFEDMRLKA